MLRRCFEITKSLLFDRVDSLLAILAIALAIDPIWPSRTAYFAIFVLCVLSIRVILDAKRTVDQFRDKHIPVLIVAGRDHDEARGMMGEVQERMALYNFDPFSYEKYFHIPPEEWNVRREGDLPKREHDWTTLVHHVEQRVIGLNARLLGKKVFH